MKFSNFHIILIVVLSIVFVNINADARSAAFGLFVNESDNDSFNYLEKILPNSFAGTLKARYNFKIIKPDQIPTLTTEDNENLKKEVNEENLQQLAKNIGSDYFIYGSFKPLDDNKIKINVNVYKKGSTSVFQFEDTGYLETEIFKLVDKITLQIQNIADESMLYKSEKINSKSKLAILTNIEGDDLNSLYYEFLSTGYKISATQGNEIYAQMDSEQIKKFYHINGVNASFHMISKSKEIELLHGTWSSAEYIKKIMEEKAVFDQYSFNYQIKENDVLKKIKSVSIDQVNYLIIIGFNKNKSSAWIRCLDLKDNKLLITQTGITGSSINEITKNIIKSITTGLPGKI